MKKIPLILFILLAVFFAVLLFRGKDPAVVKSAMIGKRAPAFDMPAAIKGKAGFSGKKLQGSPTIVNVFSSWCLECRVEQADLEKIGKEEKIRIYGINYKDKPEQLAAWLKEYGDPYEAIGADRDGRIAIDWGVYGVPETFIVDSKGIIRYKHVGVVNEATYRDIFKPLLAELRK